MARNTFHGDYREIIGDSPQMFAVLQQIESLAATPLKILISGETGTGKGMVARALHKNSGRSGEMVSVNCAAIQETLLESELFGHEKGAFTSADARHIGKFERGHKGTLFLDEIGEMPLSLQPKLLHAIEEGKIERVGSEKPITVNVRIITATNRDLAQAVQAGIFRSDLYHRLNVADISLPLLSERQADIAALVAYFLEKHRVPGNSEVLQVAANTLALLETYVWPGNVRELENLIEKGSYLAKDGILLPIHLPEQIRIYHRKSMNVSIKKSKPSVNLPIGTPLKRMEETFIRATLASLDGNRTETARVLEIGIRTLQRKLKEYDISCKGT